MNSENEGLKRTIRNLLQNIEPSLRDEIEKVVMVRLRRENFRVLRGGLIPIAAPRDGTNAIKKLILGFSVAAMLSIVVNDPVYFDARHHIIRQIKPISEINPCRFRTYFAEVEDNHELV